jgi:protein-tyrosine kinase
MSDSSGPLNLIQRAVKRAGGSPAPSAPGISANPSDATPMVHALRPDSLPSPADSAVLHAPEPQPGRHEAKHPPPPAARVRFNELRQRGMITPDNLRSNIAFEFRALKRKLLSGARDPNTGSLTRNLVLVTSALPAEGKTFTATNLALALAGERDIRVLLIDGDVIHPSLNTFFEQASPGGLTELLKDPHLSARDVIHHCPDLPNVSVIFAGGRDERTPELISSRRAADLFAEMSSRYRDRIIIIDSPPVLSSAETANLAAHAHQTVMIIASGGASRTQIQTAIDHISACPNISVVFNKAAKWNRQAGYDYYYYTRDEGGEKVE